MQQVGEEETRKALGTSYGRAAARKQVMSQRALDQAENDRLTTAIGGTRPRSGPAKSSACETQQDVARRACDGLANALRLAHRPGSADNHDGGAKTVRKMKPRAALEYLRIFGGNQNSAQRRRESKEDRAEERGETVH